MRRVREVQVVRIPEPPGKDARACRILAVEDDPMGEEPEVCRVSHRGRADRSREGDASLLASVLKEYTSGARLTVIAQNNDWAKVYDGADDLTGYILRADLAEDVMEEEILED